MHNIYIYTRLHIVSTLGFTTGRLCNESIEKPVRKKADYSCFTHLTTDKYGDTMK